MNCSAAGPESTFQRTKAPIAMLDNCVLMFSGGRDSSIAAVRLARTYKNLILVTVTADHLVGIGRVTQRIFELKPHLPERTEWIQVAQPVLPVIDSLNSATCLPCQRGYVAIGTILAKRLGINHLALGYTKYQSSWPEQTALATSRLKVLLESFGVHLQLPVYDLASKAEAESELIGYGLSHQAFEQKCMQQQNNIELPDDLLRTEVAAWEKSTSALIEAGDRFTLTVSLQKRVSEVAA